MSLKTLILIVPDETLHTFGFHFEVIKFKTNLDKSMKIFQVSFRTQKYLKGKEHLFHRQTAFSYKSQCINLVLYIYIYIYMCVCVCVCVCVCARARALLIGRKCTFATWQFLLTLYHTYMSKVINPISSTHRHTVLCLPTSLLIAHQYPLGRPHDPNWP